MSPFIIYMLKVSVFITVFFILYFLLLRKDTLILRNRVFLLASLVLSFILPLVRFSPSGIPASGFFGKMLSEVLVSPGTENNTDTGFNLLPLTTVYLTGLILFALRLTGELGRLVFLIIRKSEPGSRVIRFRHIGTPGFSALGYIFINENLSPEEADDIITHERNHLRERHYIDVLFIEVLATIQWFNPFIHLANRELRAIHEYEADRSCLRSGMTVTGYQKLLFSQVFGTGMLNLSSSFSNPSLLRRRMLMMTKVRTSALANLKVLIAVPVTLILLISASATQGSTSGTAAGVPGITDEPLMSAEVMPAFPGGDKELLIYITKNIKYPEAAISRGAKGRVIVKFCVNTDGSISDAKATNIVDPDLEAEAVRVVNTLPRFIPGMNDGKPVRVWYMVPITFTLR